MTTFIEIESLPVSDLKFMWLEITGKCQLSCTHCYASSSPTGTHGDMSTSDWRKVISDAAALEIRMIQFIGGEPTTHPDLRELVEFALNKGLQVEIFSNLYKVSEKNWGLFSLPGVSLATSYYSERSDSHNLITAKNGSHSRTRANILEALRREIPLRVGLIDLFDGQGVDEAKLWLESIGIVNISMDRVRELGRGDSSGSPKIDQLCGQCANGRLAVSPDGEVWPCVMSRWLSVGNVRDAGLDEINTGSRMAEVKQKLKKKFGIKMPTGCVPDCPPSNCPPNCVPGCPPVLHE